MKVEALKLAEAVASRRSQRRGKVTEAGRGIQRTHLDWADEKKRLKGVIAQKRADLSEAIQEFEAAKARYQARLARFGGQLESARADRDVHWVRFPDEIKILAYEASQDGASASTIRVALGTSSLQEARDIIEQGRILKEGEDW